MAWRSPNIQKVKVYLKELKKNKCSILGICQVKHLYSSLCRKFKFEAQRESVKILK